MTPDARHITDEQLIDLIEQRLSTTEQANVEAHISTCTRCSTHAVALRRAVDAMRTDNSEDAPEHLLNRAFRLLRTHRLGITANPTRRKLSALLRFDSARTGLAFGTRAGQPTTRHLMFDIGNDAELEVRVEQAEGGWRVAGQVLGNCQGGHVVLEGVAGQAATELNSQCEFSLPPQPGAIYKLVLELEDVDVEIPILELRG